MMKNAIRPVIFKWRQTAPELILCAVHWYLRLWLLKIPKARKALEFWDMAP